VDTTYNAYLRDAQGNVTLIEPPGSTFTLPSGIDDAGNVIGYFTTSDFVYHGFIRDPSGSITVIDCPGAGNGQSEGTLLGSINSVGQIACTYWDQPAKGGGAFLPDSNGTFTTFKADCAGGISSGGTSATGIDDQGQIYGSCSTLASVSRAFRRDRTGHITVFDVPGAGRGFQQGTFVADVTLRGSFVGFYLDAKQEFHSYAWIT
jgi:hypothetical protein